MTGSLRVDLCLFAHIILSVFPGRLIVAANGDLVQSVVFPKPWIETVCIFKRPQTQGEREGGNKRGRETLSNSTFAFKTMLALSM